MPEDDGQTPPDTTSPSATDETAGAMPPAQTDASDPQPAVQVADLPAGVRRIVGLIGQTPQKAAGKRTQPSMFQPSRYSFVMKALASGVSGLVPVLPSPVGR